MRGHHTTVRSQVLYPAELRARTRGKSSYCKGNPASTASQRNPNFTPKIPCRSPLGWVWSGHQIQEGGTDMAKVSIAGIRTFVEGSKGKAVHVGIDVHKRSYSVALLRSDGGWREGRAP